MSEMEENSWLIVQLLGYGIPCAVGKFGKDSNYPRVKANPIVIERYMTFDGLMELILEMNSSDLGFDVEINTKERPENTDEYLNKMQVCRYTYKDTKIFGFYSSKEELVVHLQKFIILYLKGKNGN